MRIGINDTQKHNKLTFNWAILIFYDYYKINHQNDQHIFKNYILSNCEPCETDEIVCVLRFDIWCFVIIIFSNIYWWCMGIQIMFKSCFKPYLNHIGVASSLLHVDKLYFLQVCWLFLKKQARSFGYLRARCTNTALKAWRYRLAISRCYAGRSWEFE
jgi:hypothetical protein